MEMETESRWMLRRFSFLIRESSEKASWAVWALYGQVEPDTVHFLSKVSDLVASQRICVSLWLCWRVLLLQTWCNPAGSPSNFRMSPFFPTARPRCASAKPIVEDG